MKKKSFILYCDYLEHIELLSNEETGKLFKAVLQYAASGDTKETLDSAAMMAFSFIKSQMERDNADYIAKCEKLRANGAKGGRPKQMVIEEPKAPLNDTDTVYVNDTEINKTLMVVCDLLNQAKTKARSKGRLKADTGEWIITDLLNDGFSHDDIIAIAGEVAESGKSVDWWEFDKLVRKNKRAASR